MKKLMLLMLVLLSLGAFAAPADYVVYYVKGSVTKTGGQRALRRGDSLFVQDAVLLPQGTELYLVCRDYSLLQLKKGGSFQLREVAPCPGKQQSLTASYFRYVWDELRSHHGAPEQNPRHYMRNKGAVSRGDCPMVRTALYADTIYAVNGDLNLYWTSAIPEPFLTFYPDEHDAVPVKQVPLKAGKPVRLKDLLANAGEGVAYWYITPQTAGGCNRNYLQVLPAAEY
ncbi:MAG: hypothetical protein EOP50_07080, partial [Sphingobacteriales bacterium]